ncbi:MAG: bifunctional DNA primase/polymerase [Planctomycetaceae bacterium]|nr:bifunctional DNA primase/polymerase [Planctomycetaceae bacterium]
MPSSLLESALEYARQGWPVFPLAPRGKTPMVPGGFHKATTDVDEIAKWWGRRPDANIGVPAGSATFCVVDVDPDSGGEESLQALREEYGSPPDTLRQITGSGGTHFCFKPHPGVGNTESKIAPGIDTRGNGKGYIVVAPSVHKTGSLYEWENPGTPLADIPEWLVPVERAVVPAVLGQTCSANAGWHDDSNSIEARARQYLRQCEPAIQGSGGHKALLWACTAMVWGYELDDATAFRLLAEEYNPRCVPPWDLGNGAQHREFTRKIREGRKEKLKQRGWLVDEWNREQEMLATYGRQMASALIASATGDVTVPAEPAAPTPIAASSLFTPDLLRPPGFTGDICGYTNMCARKKQPILVLGNALALAGALLGRKVRDEWDLRTNIYCLGVGASSCGKDHSRRIVKSLCTAAGIAGEILGGEEVTSDSAIATYMKTNPSCLFQWDEIGYMIASMKDKNASTHRKSIVPMLMKLYSSANSVYLGKEYASTERNDIIQPNLCLYGTTVPEKLWGGLSTDEIRDGFLSRMLVFISHDDDPEIDDSNSRAGQPPQHFVEKIAALWNYRADAPKGVPDVQSVHGLHQVTIPTHTEAQARYLEFRRFVRERRRIAAENHDATAYLWGRAEENARKVGLIVAAMDAMTLESAAVTSYHADYACRLLTALMADFAAAVGNNIADSKVELTIRKVLQWVKDAGEEGLPRRVLSNRLRNPRERNEAIDDLVREGEIFEASKDGCIPCEKATRFLLKHGCVVAWRHIDRLAEYDAVDVAVRAEYEVQGTTPVVELDGRIMPWSNLEPLITAWENGDEPWEMMAIAIEAAS